MTRDAVNLGKWILRHIFSNLIDEMIKRDEAYRKELNDNVKKSGRANAPTSIQLPTDGGSWSDSHFNLLMARSESTRGLRSFK